MKTLLFLIAIALLNCSSVFSQVAINTDGSSPHSSAGLDVNFTDKGFLLPRMTFSQRNSIQNPAEGLILYCIDCSADASGALTIYQGGIWRVFDINCSAPNTALPGTHVPSVNQIIWNWNAVPIASGYKWGTTNDFNSATDLGALTTKTESGLTCWTDYTRYVWAYNDCGQSSALTITQATSQVLFSPAPTPGSHVANQSNILWSWSPVAGATGYLWNTIDDINTATSNGTNTFKSESGLDCNTSYSRFVWAFNNCGTSISTNLTKATTLDPPSAPVCGNCIPSLNQIVWNWAVVEEAAGYKWSTTNNYSTAQDMFTETSKTETGLGCNLPYTRYVWAYSNCGVSSLTTIIESTTTNPPAAPVATAHIATPVEINWNWDTVAGATGYRWSTINDYATALDLFSATSKTESGLTCNTNYTCYVWAYSNCGISTSATMTQATPLNPPAAPVTATHFTTPVQITWNWNTVAGATGYKWNTTNDYGTAQDMFTATTTSESGLSCNNSYTRYIWAYSNCGISTSTTLIQSTSLDPPAAPVSGTHISTPNEITWNWNTVAGATGYKWNTTNDYGTAQDMLLVTTRTESSLNCNTTYNRFVWAYSDCGVSALTTLIQATALYPPAAPVNDIHDRTFESITWKWFPVAGAAGYKWNTSNDYASAEDMFTAVSKVETGLLCSTTYNRFVWAYNNCGVSISKTLIKTTLANPPAAPAAAAHIPTPVQITWNWAVVDGATGYKWNTTNNYATAQDMAAATTKTETGLSCDSSYTRYIWAYSSCGVSPSTTLTKTTSLDPPDAPLAASHVASPSQIIWNWNVVPDATGYKWNSTNEYTTAQDMFTTVTMTEPGLNCNIPYTRYIWAYGDCGVSAVTTLTMNTTNEPPPTPGAGTHVPAIVQIIWNWNAVPGAAGYKWSATNDYSTATDMGVNLTKTQTGLTCLTPYSTFVWSYNACGNSAATTLSQTTLSDPPVPPTAGTHVPSATQIVWNWNIVSGATGYKWSTTNNFATATETGTNLTYTQTGLSCLTSCTAYIWAYGPCGNSSAMTLTQTTLSNPPVSPITGTHIPSGSQIVWNWSGVTDAVEYFKWNTTNDFATATDMGTNTTKTETGLACDLGYTRYVWTHNSCGNSGATMLTQATTSEPPAIPVSGSHVASTSQIIWNWNAASGASSYKWNTTDNYATATDIGNSLTKTETGLSCNTGYDRFLWAVNSCGNSSSISLTQATTDILPATPATGTHVANYTQIVWNWNPVTGASGYKWNTTNSYSTAQDMFTATTKTETGLTCSTSLTRYVWAYNNCGESTPVTLNQSTLTCWTCGNPITINHVTGVVAPVNKSTTYGTVTNVPGETTKCWITSNLGSDHQATAVNDNTEASAGWYWQFNRLQGFKHDGTTRTPGTEWIADITETSNWTIENDPCNLELGTGWRIPTKIEYENIDNVGNWLIWTGPWNSTLKLHAAGVIHSTLAILQYRGSTGAYHSSVQSMGNTNWKLNFTSTQSVMQTSAKSYGYPIRCIK